LLTAEGVVRNPDCKPVDVAYGAIHTGDELLFRLRANPTRRVDRRRVSATQDRLSGKRVALLKEEEQLAWLRRKGETGGFALIAARVNPDVANVRANPEGTLTGLRRVVEPDGGAGQTRRLTFGSVLFEGELRVTDAATFRRTLAEGIGAGKAYGFGLLSVAPVGGAR